MISFASVGAIWLEHNAISEDLRFTDTVLVRLNLLLMLVVSFLPFPTGLNSEFHGSAGAEQVAVTLFGLTLLAASAMISVLWRHAVRGRPVQEDLGDEDAAGPGQTAEQSVAEELPSRGEARGSCGPQDGLMPGGRADVPTDRNRRAAREQERA